MRIGRPSQKWEKSLGIRLISTLYFLRGVMDRTLYLDYISVENYTFYLRTMKYTRHYTEEIPISREAVIIWASQVLKRQVDFPEAKKAFMCWIKALARNNMKYKDGVKFVRMFTFI